MAVRPGGPQHVGFHVYWARYAAERNAKFQELSYKDLRNRRLSESTLRGWIYDRKGGSWLLQEGI